MNQNTENLLEVNNLKLYFNKNSFRAVDNISFHIKKGEVFGLVGESGSGKTTTGRSIIKLYPITGGKVFFNGKLISEGTIDYEKSIKAAKKQLKSGSISKEEYKKALKENKEKIKNAKKHNRTIKCEPSIQMIFQDPVSSLDPRMTVRDIIAEGLYISGEKDEKIIDEKVILTLKKVGLLPEYMNRYPHEFSGGQRQRIGIARAIIMKPSLIIADEMVSALDVSIKAQIINLLNDLRKEMGLTVLFIAHDLSVVKYFSDRIAVMYRGKIVETAPSDELFANPMHPYTKALLSAAPLPDPVFEKKRKRIIYNPDTDHDYTKEKPRFVYLTEDHGVLCNEKELETYKMTLLKHE